MCRHWVQELRFILYKVWELNWALKDRETSDTFDIYGTTKGFWKSLLSLNPHYPRKKMDPLHMDIGNHIPQKM